MTKLQQLSELSSPYLFAQVQDFDDYYINENGDVFSTKREPVIRMKPKLNKGYNVAYVCSKSKHTTLKVHRMVASAFIPNTDNKPEVNHKDGNKNNNHVSNLEWCTRGENNLHKFRVLNHKISPECIRKARITGYANRGKRYKSQIILNTETGIFYFSIREAASSCNISEGNLQHYLSGKRKNISSFIKLGRVDRCCL